MAAEISYEERPAPPEPAARAPVPVQVTLNAVIGTVAILAGLGAIALAWYHAGNTDQVWVQMQELISGGVGGLALVIVGVGFLIRDQLARRPVVPYPPGWEPPAVAKAEREPAVGLEHPGGEGSPSPEAPVRRARPLAAPSRAPGQHTAVAGPALEPR